MTILSNSKSRGIVFTLLQVKEVRVFCAVKDGQDGQSVLVCGRLVRLPVHGILHSLWSTDSDSQSWPDRLDRLRANYFLFPKLIDEMELFHFKNFSEIPVLYRDKIIQQLWDESSVPEWRLGVDSRRNRAWRPVDDSGPARGRPIGVKRERPSIIPCHTRKLPLNRLFTMIFKQIY